MSTQSPWNQPQLLSAYQLGQQLADEQALTRHSRTRRVREVHREAHVVNGEAFIREVEVEVEETVNAAPPVVIQAPKKSWLDRLLGGGN